PGLDVHEILQVHRRHVVEVMQRYTKVKATVSEDEVPLALVADAELFRLEAIVRWLDAADVRLKRRPARAPRAPGPPATRTAPPPPPAPPRPPASGAPPPPRPLRPTRHPNKLPPRRSRNDQRARTAPGIEGVQLGAERGARAQRGRPLGRTR